MKIPKINLITIASLVTVGCQTTHQSRLDDCNDEPVFSHSCPEAGHGPCYLCGEIQFLKLFETDNKTFVANP